MRLKFVGLVLLVLSVILGSVNVFYRIFARVHACEKEYEYMISRSGRLPGSMRRKNGFPGPDVYEAEKPSGFTVREENGFAQTAAMDAGDSGFACTAPMETGEYEKTDLMGVDL